MMQKHFDIVQAIIGNCFMNNMPNNRFLYSTKNGTSTTHHPLNCIGFFSWNSSLQNDYTKFVLFPIFFDYLDSYVDLRFNCVNENFNKKSAIIESQMDNGSIDDLFLHTLYKMCSKIRNKMLHHRLNYEGTEVTASNTTVTIPHFRVINELIYQYVKFSVTGKSLFEKNALYSGLIDILKNNNNSDHEFVQRVEIMPNYVFITPYKERQLYDINAPIVPAELIINRVSRPAGSFHHENDEFKLKHPDPEEKIVFGNSYYFFRMADKYYLLPSEVVNNSKNITFGEIDVWEFQTQ
ncbi:TPA: hypothetical protein N2G37_001959 [Salmonella enterica]|nr:hypothetical protein [Salmonella enterica]